MEITVSFVTQRTDYNYNNFILFFKPNKNMARILRLSLSTETASLYLLGRREGSCSFSAVSGCHCCWPPAPSEMDHPLACRQSWAQTMIWSWQTPRSELRWNETAEGQRSHEELYYALYQHLLDVATKMAGLSSCWSFLNNLYLEWWWPVCTCITSSFLGLKACCSFLQNPTSFWLDNVINLMLTYNLY